MKEKSNNCRAPATEIGKNNRYPICGKGRVQIMLDECASS